MNYNFKDQVAIITGAGSGIGRAIALSLAKEGAICCLVGRRKEKLDEVAAIARSNSPQVLVCNFDLVVDENIEHIQTRVKKEFGRVNILVHSAGIYTSNLIQNAPIKDFDDLYRANVRAPFLLTQALLPMIRSAFGQIVFINSSQALNGKANTSQYASTQHSLKAIADSLRDEVNADGVKVISLYLGRTATPRMESIYQKEQKNYNPDLLLQPEDVAAVVTHTLSLPGTAEVTNISIRPMIKSY
jgi:NADP-dependent 3-hydroxy acid dehydrogenase YdfG